MALPEHVQEQRNALVEKVIKDIEAGKPFFWDSEHFGKPAHNMALGSSYRGLNRMRLMIAAEDKGYTDSRWCTYKQAQDKGWQVKKGEKGTHIEFWSKSVTVKEVNQETGEEEKKLKDLDCPIVKYYTVFNAQQMEGVPPEHSLTIDENEKNKYMENMLKNSEAKIFFDQSNRNFYSPTTDEIHVLPREKFKTLDGFYATCAHEIAHSTGHSTRMNRDMFNFEKSGYAKEELRAELASTFLQQQYGIKFDEKHYENHAAYLQSWAKVLKDDPNELYRAASKAQEMADYIEKNMLLKGLEQVTPKALGKGKEEAILIKEVKEPEKVSPFQEIADRSMEKKNRQQRKQKLQVSIKDKPKQVELAR